MRQGQTATGREVLRGNVVNTLVHVAFREKRLISPRGGRDREGPDRACRAPAYLQLCLFGRRPRLVAPRGARTCLGCAVRCDSASGARAAL